MPANINHDITHVPGWSIEGRYWVRDSDGLRVPIIQGGGKAVPVMRAPWAFGDDDGSESGHTLDTEGVDRDTAGSGAQAADTPFLIRIGIAETGGGTQNTGYALFADKNSGGTFTEVTTSRTDGLRIANDTQSRADDESTSERLTAGGGTFVAGKYDDGQTQQGTTAFSMSSQYSEVEFCIEIDSANASTGDVWELRVEEADGTDLASYPATLPFVEAATITPTLTVNDISHSNSLDAPSLSVPFSTFTVDFEEGDKSDFDSETNGTVLSVSATAAQVGSYGMEVDLTTAAGADAHGNNSFSGPTTRVNYRVYVDPNTLSMTAGDVVSIAVITADGTVGGVTRVGRIVIRNNAGTLECGHWAETDGGGTQTANYATMPASAFHIEGEVGRASSAVASDGYHKWYLDDVEQTGDTGMDNYDLFASMNGSALGADDLDAGTSGVIYLDDFTVSDTYIGSGGATALTMNDIAHANALDTPTLTSHQVIGTVNDIAHSNTLDAAQPLAPNQVIQTVNDIAHANALEGDLTLGTGVAASPADIDHANTLDAVTLVTHQVIGTANDIQHDNTLDPAQPLVTHQVIQTVNDISHDNTLDGGLSLGTGVAAQAADIDHANALDAVSLTPHQAISLVGDLQHDNTLDAVNLTPHQAAVVADIQHDNTLDSPVVTFTAAGALTVADVIHTNTLDAIVVTYTPGSTPVTVQEIDHSNTLDAVTLTPHQAAVVQSITHANALDGVVATFVPSLDLNDILHDNILDGVVLGYTPPPAALTVEDMIHTHILDGQRFGGVVVSFMHDHDDFFIFMI